VWKVLVPVNQAVCYGRTVPDLMDAGWLYLTWVFPAVLAGVLLLRRREWPILLAAGAVFVAGLSPMLGLFRFDYQYFSTTADHYAYLAMAGPALAVGWLVRRLGLSRPTVVSMVAAVVVILLAVRSNLQARTWRDDFTLFGHSINVAPRGVLALHNLANAHNSVRNHEQAVALYRRALEIRPTHYESAGGLSGALLRMNRIEEGTEWFRRFVDMEGELPAELRPAAYPDHLFAFASTLLRQGDAATAVLYFEKLLAIRPDDALAAHESTRARGMAAGTTRPTTE
jgi:tetratricopeptide (TPR) repeat protein